MHYDYRLALDKLETKKEMLSDFQLIFSFFLGFPSRTFTNHRTTGECEGHIFNSSLPLLLTSQTLRH